MKSIIVCFACAVVATSACTEHIPSIGGGTSYGNAPRTAIARNPEPVPDWVTAELAKAGARPLSLYFTGILYCSNHDNPVHSGKTLKQMRKHSEQDGCTGWMFVGAISKDRNKVKREEGRFADTDESVIPTDRR